MSIPAQLRGLRLPVIAAPMFLGSGPDLVVEVCRSGMVGTFPALNQRTSAGYALWLDEIAGRLQAYPAAAPFGVNLIVHKSNPRLAADLEVTAAHRVPLVITSLGAARDVVDAVHGYGGLVWLALLNAAGTARAAGRLSDTDHAIAEVLAVVLSGSSGGRVDRPLTDRDMMRLELAALLELSGRQTTRARIGHMLATGKPLRN